mmetsp:Transcript_40430/g.62189  ORF Transcript_40430/g.62189 Transcript_40430/m.62189 type:complete len:310 (+) Transcript_40430:379-1308(+)
MSVMCSQSASSVHMAHGGIDSRGSSVPGGFGHPMLSALRICASHSVPQPMMLSSASNSQSAPPWMLKVIAPARMSLYTPVSMSHSSILQSSQGAVWDGPWNHSSCVSSSSSPSWSSLMTTVRSLCGWRPMTDSAHCRIADTRAKKCRPSSLLEAIPISMYDTLTTRSAGLAMRGLPRSMNFNSSEVLLAPLAQSMLGLTEPGYPSSSVFSLSHSRFGVHSSSAAPRSPISGKPMALTMSWWQSEYPRSLPSYMRTGRISSTGIASLISATSYSLMSYISWPTVLKPGCTSTFSTPYGLPLVPFLPPRYT